MKHFIYIKKSQASVEFVLIISFVLFIFTMAFAGVVSQIEEAQFGEQVRIIKEIGDTVENEIKKAYSVRDGYLRVFELPEMSEGINYSIHVSPYDPPFSNNSEIVITSSQGKGYSYVKFFYDISVNVSHGCNLVNKSGGVIKITPIFENGQQTTDCEKYS